jgi:hypothetical protein
VNSLKRVTHIRALGVVACTLALLTVIAAPSRAQDGGANDSLVAGENPSAIPATERAKAVPILVGYFRPHDAGGLNVFEPPKLEGTAYDGFAIQWGAAFTQQYQSLAHDNNATPNVVSGVDLNSLIHIGNGFNNADANLYLDGQLARGIRVTLEMYLSSRHHNETWVKDGYLLIDASPWENELLDNIMKDLTLKLGHFEVNYGDQHFRRTDNGQAMFNPFIGNLLMDAFTTEIGGEAYWRRSGWLAMASVTGGEVRGTVTKPEQRSSSFIGKLGMDRNFGASRVRVTGSFYDCPKAINNTLYTGSRAGSRYYWVIENPNATETAQAWSGDIRPNFTAKVRAWVVNPFIKWGGVELFGNIEQSKGRSAAANDTQLRTWNQYAGEGIYRFLNNQFYVGGRYCKANGPLVFGTGTGSFTQDVSSDRIQAGGGWFLTRNLLAKAEYVKQVYYDFPSIDIRSGAHFQGGMVEATVSF